MRFNCKPDSDYFEQRERWHKWYAWYPVRLPTKECVWLEHIERRGIYIGSYDGGHWHYEYIEHNVPSNIRVWVTYHRPRNRRDKWRTDVKLIDLDSEAIVAHATAQCSRRDNPNKKIGRAIAVGRAFKKYALKHNVMERGE